MGEHGKIEQIGTPNDLFFRPNNRYVAEFIGSPPMNFVDCKLTEGDDRPMLKGEDFEISTPPEKESELEDHVGEEVILGIRPRDISEVDSGTSSKYAAEGEVERVKPVDMPIVILRIRIGEDVVRMKVEGSKKEEGEKITIKFNPEKIHVFDKESGEALINAEMGDEAI